MKTGSETEIVDDLYRISSLVNKTEDSDEALKLILATVIDVLDANRASIALRIPESKNLRIEIFQHDSFRIFSKSTLTISF